MTAGSPGGVFGPFKTIEHPHVSQLEAPLPYLQHFHRHFSAGFFGGHGPLRTLHGDSEADIWSLATPPREARTGTGIKSRRRSIYPPSASPGRMNNGTVLEGKLDKTRNRVITTTQCANGNTPGAAQKAHRAVLKKRTSHQHSVRPLLFFKKNLARPRGVPKKISNFFKIDNFPVVRRLLST